LFRPHIARQQNRLMVHSLLMGFLASGHPENHQPFV
jgi:hypothetical protein